MTVAKRILKLIHSVISGPNQFKKVRHLVAQEARIQKKYKKTKISKRKSKMWIRLCHSKEKIFNPWISLKST